MNQTMIEEGVCKRNELETLRRELLERIESKSGVPIGEHMSQNRDGWKLTIKWVQQ